MYRVAICDDDAVFRQKLKNVLAKNFFYSRIRLDEFVDGTDIMNEIENGVEYDIIFMDIAMREMNGDDAVKKIRSFEVGANSIVIFLTSYEADISQIVELKPFAYIYKKTGEEYLNEKINKAFEQIESGQDVIEIKSNRIAHRIRYRELRYIESNRNSLDLYTLMGKYTTRSYNLSEIVNAIKSPKFIQVSASVLVNYDYVKHFTAKTVEMDDGKVFSITKKFKGVLALK